MSDPLDPYTYWRVGDAFIRVLGGSLAEGATPLSADEYTAQRAALEAETSSRLAAAADAAAAAAAAQGGSDYAALVAVGVPAATASRLTGYQPPEEAP